MGLLGTELFRLLFEFEMLVLSVSVEDYGVSGMPNYGIVPA